jgi:hypothetical protein
MSQERLTFEVVLSGTYWDKKPQFSVWVDDHVVVQSEIAEPNVPQPISFKRELDEGSHQLKVRLENKTDQDTKVVDDEVIKDMLLNIEDIIIDDISLGSLCWDATYILDKPHEFQGETINHLDQCVNLGWNGTYILKFSTPFYIWLLEKL